MVRDGYVAQVQLLVRILPIVAEETVFALKGGTAINLFYRDLPRLSVDIDLTYLPVKDRVESLAEIDAAMTRVAAAIQGSVPGVRVQRNSGGDDQRYAHSCSIWQHRNQDRNLAGKSRCSSYAGSS